MFAGGRAFPVPQKELAKLRGVDHAVVMAAGGSPAPQTSSQLAPGTLLTAQHVTGKPAIYVVAANGELYGFAGPRQLRDGGFDPALVVTVPSLSGLTVARQSAGAAHLDAWSTRADGALVVSGREDYVLAGGRALHVPGQSSLSVIRKADGAKAVPGTVTKREALAQMANGTLVSAKESGYAGVYVAFDGEMFAFSSLGQLDAEGYGGTAAVPVPPASVASGW